jgi:hypothetical protein
MAIELVGNNLDVVNPFETILPGIPKSQSRRANRRWLGPQPVLEYGASIAFVVAGMTLKWSDSSPVRPPGLPAALAAERQPPRQTRDRDQGRCARRRQGIILT